MSLGLICQHGRHLPLTSIISSNLCCRVTEVGWNNLDLCVFRPLGQFPTLIWGTQKNCVQQKLAVVPLLSRLETGRKCQRFLPGSKNEETLIPVNRSRGKTASFNRRVSTCYPKAVFFHSSLTWRPRCPYIALNNQDVATSSNSRWSENGLN